MVRTLFLVALGGMLGSICRFLLSLPLLHYFPTSYPLPTFLVNMSGCFLMGIFWGLGEKQVWLSSDLRLLCMTGFCGGFTTFSAFALENVALLQKHSFLLFFGYTFASVFLGIMAVFGGYWIVR